MRLPTPEGRYPEFDDPFYGDVPWSASLSSEQLVAIVDRLVDGAEAIMLAGSSVDRDNGPAVAPSVDRAYERELARLGIVLATKLGPAKTADVTEMGYLGFRWIVRGVPIVLTAYQEDRELPVEIFVTRVTPEMRSYLPPSLVTARAPRTSATAARRRAPSTDPRGRVVKPR